MKGQEFFRDKRGLLIKRLNRLRAERVQRRIGRNIDAILARVPEAARELPFDVYAYCGERSALDQMVTLRNFLRVVGAPRRFILLSDGSLRPANWKRLQQLHPCTQVRDLPEWQHHWELSPPSSYLNLINEKMGKHHFAKKLHIMMALSMAPEPVLYTDSDVLFFPTTDVAPLLGFEGELFYLHDAYPALDDRLVLPETKAKAPINAGFCVYGRPVQWDEALARLREFEGEPTHHSEQTLVHNMMHLNGASELPRRRFLLSLADQRRTTDIARLGDTVCRHYVLPVRPKMWLHEPYFYS